MGGAPADDDVAAFLAAEDAKDQLRFITCGSVDDGKSTLLGRLLHDSRLVLEDQLQATEAESRKYGARGGEIDLALLVDGLQAEREQGITIDVAYRYFETDKRKFIAADTPGHEQYTRNMATGASTADLAVILVDARKGVLTQTRRHSHIVALLGIRHVVLAVNKMDLVDYDKAVFDRITADYGAIAAALDIADLRAIPLSALEGENVFVRHGKTPWYDGPTLMALLESIDIHGDETVQPFRLPVQWVNRPSPDFRGFSGLVISGAVQRGETLTSALTGRSAEITRIIGPSGDLAQAVAGQSVTITLSDEIDIGRGDMLTRPGEAPEVSDQFAAQIIWMDQEPMLPERTYAIRFTAAQATAQITDLTHKVDVNTLDHSAAKTLELNEIGYCKLALDRPVAFDAYEANRLSGGFVLIDRISNATAGAGVIAFGLRRARNIEWRQMTIDKAARARAIGQKPCVLWFTGLSGSGKSTIADLLEQKLHAAGRRTYLLDGDNIRHGLNKDLGFTDTDRVENIRRIAEVARLMVDAGLIVIASFISPFRAERRMARKLMADGEFVEIFIDTPLATCESRDPKGLYRKARAGELKNFTGIDSAYETPESAEIILKGDQDTPEALADQIIDWMRMNDRR